MNDPVFVAAIGSFSGIVVGLFTYLGTRRSVSSNQTAVLLEERRLELERERAERIRLEKREDALMTENADLKLTIAKAQSQAVVVSDTTRSREMELQAEIEYLKEQLNIR